uniref:Uncharacterized protein n=1 Tax=Meloidogyne enterolobii TaxID=390850 RepID=A0A6V7WJW8_MELEN|nr:unnamed protein product [Meloidogyne enterolobii]
MDHHHEEHLDHHEGHLDHHHDEHVEHATTANKNFFKKIIKNLILFILKIFKNLKPATTIPSKSTLNTTNSILTNQ